jgi:hypothetical protein
MALNAMQQSGYILLNFLRTSNYLYKQIIYKINIEYDRNAYRILVGKPEGKRPLGRPRHKWEDNIRMDLREI